jgi:hypothetical protein
LIGLFEPIPHAVFWSLLINIMSYAAVSVSFKGNTENAIMPKCLWILTNTSTITTFVWKGTAHLGYSKVLQRFLGEDRTKRALFFNLKYNIDKKITTADARFIKFAEKFINGSHWYASAKILISSVVKEDKISLPKVLRILEESKKSSL